MKKTFTIVNTVLLIGVITYLFNNHDSKNQEIFEEVKAERLSIVGPDGHLYISISNPDQQAVATMGGKPIHESDKRDLPGIIFFNRIGDEVGGIYYDGTDAESYAGITFDQQKNDQIMAIMKDEYKDGDEWKRWYGMFFRERSDSIAQVDVFKNFYKETKNMSDKEKEKRYKEMRKFLDEELNVYRMFLGREETENVGLFLYDSKGRERIKLYVDKNDQPRLEIIDPRGFKNNLIEQFNPEQKNTQ